MKFYHILKKVTLILILILVVLLCFLALIFIIKETFNYSIFTAMTETLFASAMGAMILLVIGLSIINITANLNLISEGFTKDQLSEIKVNYTHIILKAAAVIVGVAILTWLSLHLINRRNTHMTAEKMLEELTDIPESQSELITQLIENLQNETNLTEIKQLIEMIDGNIFHLNYIEVLFPKMVNGNLVYLRIDRWSNYIVEEKYYSPISDTLYITEKTEEKKYLEDIYSGEKTEAEYFVDRPYISAYSPIYADGELVCVLYSSYNEIYQSYRKLESSSYY